MAVIGTAGHVDHGKSTLIRALTGRDPDRWQLEKDRGLTIDLGFAWATLPSGEEVSFVDVPGHERYLKNMLAGIEAVDVALVVIAADEGWMPQTEEHLAVLDLLAVERGVVALSKVDLVDPELAGLGVEEAREHLVGTSLENAPIVMVSAASGEGLGELVAALADLLPTDSPPGRPRLWVDRSFAVAGAGTVVTGTLLGGKLAADQAVEILPEQRSTRIRGIQSHERAVDSVDPGRRVAINLSGVAVDDVGRGDMIGLPGHWVTTNRVSAFVRLARYADHLDERGAYQLHIGSTAVTVDIVAFQDGVAILKIGDSLPIATGDRFIIRDTGRRLVVAGGTVADPAPGATRQAIAQAAMIDPTSSVDQIAESLLEIRGHESITLLAAHSNGGRATSGVEIESEVFHPKLMDELVRRLEEMTTATHRSSPLRDGLPLATAANRLGVGRTVVEALVARSSNLKRVGPEISSVDHEPTLSEDDGAARKEIVDRLSEGLAVPTLGELGHEEVVHYMLRRDELIRISDEIVYLPDQVSAIEELIEAMDGEFTVSDFRERAGMSRKYAVPVLEWADREGLTVRRGDVRLAR